MWQFPIQRVVKYSMYCVNITKKISKIMKKGGGLCSWPSAPVAAAGGDAVATVVKGGRGGHVLNPLLLLPPLLLLLL